MRLAAFTRDGLDHVVEPLKVRGEHFIASRDGLLGKMPRDVECPSGPLADEIAALVGSGIAETWTLRDHDNFWHRRTLSSGRLSALSDPTLMQVSALDRELNLAGCGCAVIRHVGAGL